MNKTLANFLHVRKRLRERYNLEATPEMVDSICKQIQKTQRCRKEKQLTLRRSVWLVRYTDEITLRVVYEDNKKAGRKSIVTALPLKEDPWHKDPIPSKATSSSSTVSSATTSSRSETPSEAAGAVAPAA